MGTKRFDKYRNQYSSKSLVESQLALDPIQQFEKWFSQAAKKESKDPNAMVLSTVSATGRPSSRVVLLKDLFEDGFTFFTNYLSRKGKELHSNPYASLLFYWPTLMRQVKIEGRVKKRSAQANDTYFYSRPINSQAASIASSQSRKLSSKKELVSRFEKILKEESQIKRPDHWGGYIVKPTRFEFWQGQPDRMHDCFLYKKRKKIWSIERLNP